MAYFIFWIFFNETWHICRWAWKNNNLKVSLKFIETVESQYCQKFVLRQMYTCRGETGNFSLPKKLDLRSAQ
jgi:hypothetical protein